MSDHPRGIIGRHSRNSAGTISIWAAVGIFLAALSSLPALAQNPARLTNISSRALVGSGSNALIAGFVVGGSGSETLLIRADGPALAQFGVSGILTEPTLRVIDNNGGLVASNTGWANNSNPALVASAAASAGAFALAPGSADCALLVTLAAGAYTAQIAGLGNSAGVALAEIYEVSSSGTRLTNFSVRAQVGTGADRLISGIVVSGTGDDPFLVRADGPALTQFGIGGVLAQPTLTVLNGAGTQIASNTGWDSGFGSVAVYVNTGLEIDTYASQIAAEASVVGAFPLAANSGDSAEILSLPPGPYILQVSGVNNTTGVGLAEVYEMPPQPVSTIPAPPVSPPPQTTPGTGTG